MKLSAITFLALAAGAIAAPAPAPEAEVAPQEEKREASPGYASYGDYKGAGENLPSYPSYGTYGAKPKPKPKPKPAPKKPAPKKYTNYGKSALLCLDDGMDTLQSRGYLEGWMP